MVVSVSRVEVDKSQANRSKRTEREEQGEENGRRLHKMVKEEGVEREGRVCECVLSRWAKKRM